LVQEAAVQHQLPLETLDQTLYCQVLHQQVAAAENLVVVVHRKMLTAVLVVAVTAKAR